MQITWPVVALIGSLLGAIVAILALVPANDQRGQTIITVIAGALSSLLAAMFAARRAENAITQQPAAAGDPEPADQPAPEQVEYRPYRPTDQP